MYLDFIFVFQYPGPHFASFSDKKRITAPAETHSPSQRLPNLFYLSYPKESDTCSLILTFGYGSLYVLGPKNRMIKRNGQRVSKSTGDVKGFPHRLFYRLPHRQTAGDRGQHLQFY